MCVQPRTPPIVVVQALAEALDEIRADELAIRGPMRSQAPGYGMRVGARLDRADDERAVDRHAHPHVVHRLARGRMPVSSAKSSILDVDEVRLDVEQAVVARGSRRNVTRRSAGVGAGRG